MAGTVIGKTMNFGWAGKVARDADVIIDSRIVNLNSDAIKFGAPVFLNADNTVRAMAATDTDATMLAGVAVSGVRQSINYVSQEAEYLPGTQCDILTRGVVMVALPAAYTTTPAAGAAVYLGANGFTPDADGNFDTGYKFTTGLVDANGMAEVTILTKNVL